MSQYIGQEIGGYRVVEQVGQGGMATVFKAYDASMDRFVALKLLPEYYAKDPQFLKRFEREAKALAKLEHLHILPVFSYGQQDDLTYLVMRYLPTGTLLDRIQQQGRMSLAETKPILTQIASGLDHAHHLGILHRDVKPSNVLLDKDGNAYLTDFGIAKMVEGADIHLTRTGGIVGTPAYMSPEQCQGSETLTGASDQYSLGIMLYQMVTGQVPFQAETPLAIIHMQLTAPLPPPRMRRGDLPEAAEQAMLKALARDPADRYPTCSLLAEAWSRAIDAVMPVIGAESFGTLIESGGDVDSSVERLAQPAISIERKAHIATEVGRGTEGDPNHEHSLPGVGAPSVKGPTAASMPRAGAPMWLWPVIAVVGIATLAGAMLLGLVNIGGDQSSAELPGLVVEETELPSESGSGLPDDTVESVESAPSPTAPAVQLGNVTYSEGEVLFADDFEDGNLDGWSVNNGQGFVTAETDETGNGVQRHAPIGNDIFTRAAAGDPSWTNYATEFRVRVVNPVTGDNGPVISASVRNNIEASFYNPFITQSGHVVLFREQPPSSRAIGRGDIPFESNTWHTVRIEVFEGNLHILVDGSEVVAVSDSEPLRQGYMTLGTHSGAVVDYDDVRVVELVGGGVYTQGGMLLDEDFEDGDTIGWKFQNVRTGQSAESQWEVVEDEDGNRVLRATAPADTEIVGIVGEVGWRNYTFTVQFRIRHAAADFPICCTLFFRTRSHAGSTFYTTGVGLTGTFAAREGASVMLIDHANPTLNLNQWYTIAITHVEGASSALLDDQELYSVVDPDPAPSGAITLAPGYDGSSADVVVDFDDVRVVEIIRAGE